ncbi:fibronectin type III domain-containing protein [Natrialba aegyptia DSM 13077]|uniref:Fibronectin type III domain-containing protein n=3 Tax=Natrialba aegyptia TaxID=129789 RepID=M0B3C3_9EURY|nr:fibronectin type III domain-containing protein [Natrialba aegyptia DSM 13077]
MHGDNDIVGMSGAGSNFIDGSATVIANERGTGNSGDGLIEIEYELEPDAPQNLSLQYDSSLREIATNWDGVTDADGYRLYLSDEQNAAETGSVVVDTTTTSHTETDVPDGDQRYYQVVAYIDVESDPSNEVDVLTDLPPAENLTVESVSGRYATLSWVDPSNNASGYRLLLSEDDDGSYQQDGSDISPANQGETVTYETTELLDGQLYGATVETFTDYTSAREDQ